MVILLQRKKKKKKVASEERPPHQPHLHLFPLSFSHLRYLSLPRVHVRPRQRRTTVSSFGNTSLEKMTQRVPKPWDPGQPITRRRQLRWARPRVAPRGRATLLSCPTTICCPPGVWKDWLAFPDASEADLVGGGQRLVRKLAGATRSVGFVALIARFSLLLVTWTWN